MSYNALRKGRVSLSQHAYFVTAVTRDRVRYFERFDLARIVARELNHFDCGTELVTLAWVVMPDHIHWLFQLKGQFQLPIALQRLKGRTSRQVNMALGSSGPIWQPNYFDRGLRPNEDIREVARYICANPVRAGLAEKVADYSHWDACWL